MNRALIKGYYGFRNAGDDALLLVTAWGVRTYCHADEVLAASARIPLKKTALARSIYFDWPFFRRYNVIRERRIAKTAQMTIWGGGSVFQSVESIEACCSLLNYAPDTKAFAIGVSIGPFRDRQSEAACGAFLSQLSYVGVRDRISYERAVALAPNTPTEVTFDLAPLLCHLLPRRSGLIAPLPRTIGISLCGYKVFVERLGDSNCTSLRILAEAVRLVAASGAVDAVTLFDFTRYHAEPNCDIHESLRHLISPYVHVERCPYNDNPFSLMDAISGVKLLLAMPLHASIFAFCANTPTIILPYHEKCREFAKMIGHSSKLQLEVKDLNARDLATCILDALDDQMAAPTVSLESAYELAMRNWTGVGTHVVQ